MKIPIEAQVRWQVVKDDEKKSEYLDFGDAFAELKSNPHAYQLLLVYCESCVLFENVEGFLYV